MSAFRKVRVFINGRWSVARAWWTKRRGSKFRGVHRHRDLYIPLTPALLGLGGIMVTAVPTAAITGAWSYILLVGGVASIALGLYITAALIWTWPLPGGLAGHAIGSNESDEAIGRECLTLSQSMLDVIAEAKRNAPPLSTFTVNPGEPGPAFSRQAQEAGQKSYEYGERIVAQFIERFGVRLASVTQALETRNLLTSQEARQLWWWLRTFHWLERIPQVIVEKARLLGVKP